MSTDPVPRRWRAVLPIALVVWLISALAVAAYLVHDRRRSDGAAAVAVAGAEVTNFFQLDHRDPSRGVDRVLALATGTFHKEYAAQRSSIVASLTKQKLTVSAKIPKDGLGLEYLHDDHARALAAVDVTSRAGSDAVQNHTYRVRLSLLRIHGAWLVSALDEVS